MTNSQTTNNSPKTFEPRAVLASAKDIDNWIFPFDEKLDRNINFRVGKNETFKACYFHFNSARYHIKMQIGGRQILFGRVRNPVKAIRFADLLSFHFWKYRKARPPVDSDFNQPLEVVRADYEACQKSYGAFENVNESVVHKLKCIERYLLDCGIISTPKEEEKSYVPAWVELNKSLEAACRKAQQVAVRCNAHFTGNEAAQPSVKLVLEAARQLNKFAESLRNNFLKGE